MKQIFWQTEYEEANESMIEHVETITKLHLPQEYLAIARKYQGGYPSLRNIDIKGYGTTVFDALLTFVPFDQYDIIEAYNTVRSRGNFEYVFPFAMAIPYSFYCFDYRENKERPILGYWSRARGENSLENIFIDISDTFTGFVNKLY